MLGAYTRPARPSGALRGALRGWQGSCVPRDVLKVAERTERAVRRGVYAWRCCAVSGPRARPMLSVYIFLSCIQIVVIDKGHLFLWITTYTSIESEVCVYQKHRDEVLVSGDDSAFCMRPPEVYVEVVPYTSPCQPQQTHNVNAGLSTAGGRVIHRRRVSTSMCIVNI